MFVTVSSKVSASLRSFDHAGSTGCTFHLQERSALARWWHTSAFSVKMQEPQSCRRRWCGTPARRCGRRVQGGLDGPAPANADEGTGQDDQADGAGVQPNAPPAPTAG